LLVGLGSEQLLHPLQLVACIVCEGLLRIQQQVTNEAMSLVYYNVYVSPLGVGEEEGDREEEEEEREEEGTGRRRRKKKGRKRGIEKGGRSAIVNVRDEPYLQGI